METERLILRRWEDSDAESLYEYAKDPAVGPITGWPPHESVEESRNVIKTVLSAKEAYAICLKTDNKAIGDIELKLNGHTDLTERDDECELGYWLGKPFWGRGIMPEAAREMLRHAFEDLGMTKVWVGYYEGNDKSRRVQEKCGFRYQWKSEGVDVPLMHEKRTGYVSSLTKEEWEQDRLAVETKIRLAKVTEENWLDVASLAVKDSQKVYVAPTIGILARGYVYRDCHAKIFVIENDGSIVGAALVREFEDEPLGYDLQQFMIDRRYQGRGYGSRALQLILDDLRREARYDHVEVCVKKEDTAAIHVYEKLGFVDSGYVDEEAPDSLNMICKLF